MDVILAFATVSFGVALVSLPWSFLRDAVRSLHNQSREIRALRGQVKALHASLWERAMEVERLYRENQALRDREGTRVREELWN